jgi:hypothetical protein
MRKAIIGALGLITVIVLVCFTGCKKVDPAGQKAQADTIYLNPGRKLVSCDWNTYSRDVMYITRPMEANEKATDYEYRTRRGSKVIIFKEEARRDMSSGGRIGLDDAIRQMRMEE